MPGPMSSPNGDKSLTVASKFVCARHGVNAKARCAAAQARQEAPCVYISKREHLLRRNRLYTGKTSK